MSGNRRLIAAIAAMVVAVMGTVLLVNYVNDAEQRAMAEMSPVEVLVVTEPISEGTPVEEMVERVTTESLPQAAVGPDPVTSLSEVAGLVAATGLEPGEQALANRFTNLESLFSPNEVPVPPGLHQVSINLGSAQVAGGRLAAGDTVGVFITVDGQTHLALNKILVVRVEGAAPPAPRETEDGTPSAPSTPMHEGGMMATLAVNARDAETIVFASEMGSVWLTLEDPEAPTDGTRIISPENIFE